MGIHQCKSTNQLVLYILKNHQLNSISYMIFICYICRHAAVSYGHATLIEYLLDNGANIHIRDIDGDTPLLMCEDPDIFELLLQHGANPTDTNNAGECLLEKAIEDENEILIGYLISNHHMSSEQTQALMAKRQKSLDSEHHQDEEDDDGDEEDLLPDDEGVHEE